MAEIIEMPKLSDTMETGTLVSWLKNEGDQVSSGDMIAEVETDKATMEVECFEDGVILKQYVKVGESVPVGAPMVAIGEKDEAPPEVDMPEAPAPEKDEKAEEASDSEEEDEAPEPHDDLKTPATPAEAVAPVDSSPTPEPEVGSDGKRIKASPLARKLAAQKGVSLVGIEGSGPAGRIVKKDVLSALEGGTAKPAGATALSSSTSGTASAVMPADLSSITETRQDKVSNMRGAIARRLLESKTSIPHFYLEIEVDSAPLGKMRKALNEQFVNLEPQQGGAKFTVNDLILKASVEALRRVPAVNASWQGDHIQQNGAVHIAFGVAVDEGLVTPVIRDAQLKSIRQISAEAKELIGKARNKKLKPDEMSGSTFTVTNLGMFGITNFYGIINPPNAGILSVGAPVRKPVVNEAGEIVAGERMSIGFSGDHRVVDGATGALFLNAIRDILQTPASLLV